MLAECVCFTQQKRLQLLYDFLLLSIPSCSCILREYCVPINLFQKNWNERHRMPNEKAKRKNTRKKKAEQSSPAWYTQGTERKNKKKKTKETQKRCQQKKKCTQTANKKQPERNASSKQPIRQQASRTLSLSQIQQYVRTYSANIVMYRKMNRIMYIRSRCMDCM